MPGLSTAEEGAAARMKVVEHLEVVGITLDELLERNGVTELDLLSIDVEEHQSSVLAGFDLERWQPKLVCIEDDGPISIPWFKERGYEPIERYRDRDISNWYFAPKALALAANARATERGREEIRKREAIRASAAPDSPVRAYGIPRYLLGPDGLPVLNPRWEVANAAVAAAASQAPEQAVPAHGVVPGAAEVSTQPPSLPHTPSTAARQSNNAN